MSMKTDLRLWGTAIAAGLVLGVCLSMFELSSQERHTMISRAHSDTDPNSPGTAQLGDMLVATGTPPRWNFLRIAANGRVLQVTAGVPAWSATGFPAAAGPTGTILRSNGTDWVATTATYPGAVVTAGQVLRSDGVTGFTGSTMQYLDSIAINEIPFASAANSLGVIAAATNAVLVSSAGGVPSMGSTLPNAVQDNITRLGSLTTDVVTSAAVRPGSVTFASLGADPNGTLRYCSDCTIANPCAGAGTGALAKRINATWICN
jgi:hypothetical protein